MLNLIRMLVSLDTTVWLERPEMGYTSQCLEISRDYCKKVYNAKNVCIFVKYS